jgi:hypothetical protein
VAVAAVVAAAVVVGAEEAEAELPSVADVAGRGSVDPWIRKR